jgi:hypothetical protein
MGRVSATILIVSLLFLYLCLSTPPVRAEVYHITNSNTYFHSVDLGATYAYINFDSSILPLSFTTLYRDSQQRVHFNTTWIKTNVNLTVTLWFSNNWFNYSATGGTQQLYASKPEYVYFDNVEQTENTTWSYSDYVITVNPSGTDVGMTWEAGAGGESEYENPIVTSSTVWYMRYDTHTVNTVVGYVLNETESAAQTLISESIVGNVSAYFGWRVWHVDSQGGQTELTNDYVWSWRVGDGEGVQNILWNAPTRSLRVGFDAIKTILYVKFTDVGPPIAKAIFVSDLLIKKTLVGTEWAFQTYTQKSFSGGSTVATVYWGASANETSIAGIQFVDPNIYEKVNYNLAKGDLVTAVTVPYTDRIGNLFYGLVMLMVCVPLYNRYKSLTPILILFIIFGGATGIFSLLTPIPALGLAWVFMLLGLAGLLYKVFR